MSKEGEDNMPLVQASCLCGGVKFEITGPLPPPVNCHCSICRKQHGAAFRSRVRIKVADFIWLQGKELVTFYESTPGYHRGFCRVCGSPILNKATENFRIAASRPVVLEEYGIALAILDVGADARPERHIFVGSKAAWFVITDDLPQHAEFPPRP